MFPKLRVFQYGVLLSPYELLLANRPSKASTLEVMVPDDPQLVIGVWTLEAIDASLFSISLIKTKFGLRVVELSI